MTRRSLRQVILIVWCGLSAVVYAEQAGSIRGIVFDRDFDAPLPAGKVLIAETDQSVTATDQGNYLFEQVAPGAYTLVFSKDGYVRQVRAGVVVSAGQMTEVNVSLAGEFEEMEEFVVQDVQIGAATEAALLDLRMESPALMDSISSEMMSRAGAGDAAAALRLVSGATVQDGKYATVRGLPDRYVSSQMNSVRLPTADADKRAVQLDQFPSAVIDSMQVSKTFMPDQQGDASGGAVNVVLKGIPDGFTFNFSISTGWDSPSAGNDFLSYKGGGVNGWGRRDSGIPSNQNAFDKTLSVSDRHVPTEYKWSTAVGNKWDFDNFRLGAFGSFFYERKSSSFDDGIDDKYWLESLGLPMTPQYSQGTPDPAWNPEDPYNPPQNGDFMTSLFDVKQSQQSVQWGGMGILGIETENHAFSFMYMYTRDATDKATLAENTRGKEYYFPGYDRDNPAHPGNTHEGRVSSPYLRLETLEYTERTTETYQLSGRHTLPNPEIRFGNLFSSLSPELDWTFALSEAGLYQPDKRLFGSVWKARGQHSFFPAITYPEGFSKYRPAVNVNLGSLQRIWKEITEDSTQYFANLKLPYEQWSGDEGYIKFGIFNDSTRRKYNQDTFSNPNDGVANYQAPWERFWSDVYPSNTVTASNIDIDYKGDQDIAAWYYMADVPLNSWFKMLGGVRFEKTDLSIRNFPDTNAAGNPVATWFDPDGGQAPMVVGVGTVYPNGPDVVFSQRDVLPAIGFEFKPWDTISIRGSFTETVARQTFKELSPIVQQEYLGGPIFVGNPNLKMSALKNYDLRFDYVPYQGGLFSASYFYKDIEDPIEYVQGFRGFSYTYPVNYPKGKLSGFELEIRQQMDRFFDSFEGISVGANATWIDSEVTLREKDAQELVSLNMPEPTRQMTNAPEHLYNFYIDYDLSRYGTQLSLYYTIRGDTLVAGAGETNGKYIPHIYETEFGTLNFSWTQKLGEIWKLRFQAKNLLDPKIETVYRSKYIGPDVTKTSYRKGMEFSIGLSASF